MGVGPDGTMPPEIFLDGAPMSIGGGASGDIASRYDNITDGVLNLVGDEYVFFWIVLFYHSYPNVLLCVC